MKQFKQGLTQQDLKWLAHFLAMHKAYESDDVSIMFYENLIERISVSYELMQS